MRFHVVSLPHTNTTEGFSSCAYTEKVRNFCRMMTDRGHEVFLYAGEANSTPCTEHVACTTEEERLEFLGGKHYTAASFDYTLRHWIRFNQRAADQIRSRALKKDFLCLIGGLAHKQVADSLPSMLCVEFGVGYGGYFSKFRVFESYAWMHTCYGARSMNDPHGVDGEYFDAVIPGYLDPDEFELKLGSQKEDYFLYVGRLIDRKGWRVAVDVCERLGKQLVVAGPGTPPPLSRRVEYLGPVEADVRNRLMANARALFVPTQYVEPFGNVAIEAMVSGTPVISTDWGAMTETVVHGVTGYRCRTLSEFVKAAQIVGDLDSLDCHDHVVSNYSLPVIAEEYERHFRRLTKLWGEGWYQMESDDVQYSADGDGDGVRADDAEPRAAVPAPATAA